MTNFPYAKRSEQVKKAIRERLEAQKAAFGDPVPQPKFLAETLVEGRTVADWAKDMDALVERVGDERLALLRNDDNHQVIPVVDMTEQFSPAASNAVSLWRQHGSHTEFDETKARIDGIREKAEAQQALAAMEDNMAQELEGLGKPKKAEQHSRYAITHREKATKLFEEAEAVRIAWKKEHP